MPPAVSSRSAPVSAPRPRARPAQDDANTHQVRRGENLFRIAQQHGLTLQQLLQANPQIRDPSEISVGQRINIPERAAPAGRTTERQAELDAAPTTRTRRREDAPQSAPVPRTRPATVDASHIRMPDQTHRVQRGDTLSSIARRHGLSMDDLLRANPQIRDANDIDVGHRVVIPEGSRRSSAAPADATRVESREPAAGAPPNRTAQFQRVQRAGQRRQMQEGQITINGNTYNFRTGGHGNGNLPPGQYTVTPHLWSRSDRSMNVGGVGYSFALNDAYDRRVGARRTELRIHPDGGVPGTLGCIGIVGDAAVQRRFREDMRAELQRSGGRFTLNVE